MASKRRLRRRGCEGKRSYVGQADAVKVAGGMCAQLGGYPFRAYKCNFCNHWHVGTPPKNVLQGIKASDK